MLNIALLVFDMSRSYGNVRSVKSLEIYFQNCVVTLHTSVCVQMRGCVHVPESSSNFHLPRNCDRNIISSSF